MTRKAKLIRFDSSEQGTFSALLIESTFFCYFGELPWRNNLQSISCIPAGTYLCKLVESPKFGHVYQLQSVPDRTHILIHAGNYVGNKDKGYKTNSYGCLLPGSSVGELSNQQAVTASRYTLKKLMDELDGEDFELTIKDCYE
ncbi:MAG: hypothetical protein COA86_02790 [Kangiella sp.]|nr:MAG: hypothetical protein COA86_02790 [Kangiella sp.]